MSGKWHQDHHHHHQQQQQGSSRRRFKSVVRRVLFALSFHIGHRHSRV